jgi:hypothetical protein
MSLNQSLPPCLNCPLLPVFHLVAGARFLGLIQWVITQVGRGIAVIFDNGKA